ncbi:hypothetical protein R3P38DRAFT_2793645 [Favolaschia claudopus]|uniref:Uncharacterized protein n=1 Tax=Favolaschia claudopus TaxID=2862362 RepID=A0AAW0ADN7_9AGAR
MARRTDRKLTNNIGKYSCKLFTNCFHPQIKWKRKRLLGELAPPFCLRFPKSGWLCNVPTLPRGITPDFRRNHKSRNTINFSSHGSESINSTPPKKKSEPLAWAAVKIAQIPEFSSMVAGFTGTAALRQEAPLGVTASEADRCDASGVTASHSLGDHFALRAVIPQLSSNPP